MMSNLPPVAFSTAPKRTFPSLANPLSQTDEPARRRKVRLRLERCWELLQLEEERKPTVRRI